MLTSHAATLMNALEVTTCAVEHTGAHGGAPSPEGMKKMAGQSYNHKEVSMRTPKSKGEYTCTPHHYKLLNPKPLTSHLDREEGGHASCIIVGSR
jgi:hypothetical protein